jgi:hypothetical protein
MGRTQYPREQCSRDGDCIRVGLPDKQVLQSHENIWIRGDCLILMPLKRQKRQRGLSALLCTLHFVLRGTGLRPSWK